MNKQYKTVVGLEVHVELITKTKAFYGCSTRFGEAPNTHTCLVCTGMSGSLPVLSKQAMKYALAVGLAANCQINQYCKFNGKSYFYSDSPQNYQMSQLCLSVYRDGWMGIETEPSLKKRMGIHEIHVEESADRLIHDEWEDRSPVDYSRSEVPLIEIASEPGMRNAEEVIACLEKLELIIQYLGASDCRLREESMRADVSLSVREAGAAEFNTRTEVKNLNSFKTITRATERERRYQIELLEGGRRIIQETRRQGDSRENSKTIQSKKDARGYRYFPDPGLVPVVISDEWITQAKVRQPKLRTEKIARYMEEHGLPEYDTRLLTNSRHMAGIFGEATRLNGRSKETSNRLMVEAMCLMKGQEMEPEDMGFSPTHLAALIDMVEKNAINRTVAKAVFEEVFRHDADPEACMEEKGLKVIRDEGVLRCTVEAVMAANPQSVKDYRSDRGKAIRFLAKQTMKAMKGKANPVMASQLVRESLDGGDA